MHRARLPSVARLRVTLALTSSGLCTVAGVLILLFLAPVVRLSREQVIFCVGLIVAMSVPLVALSVALQRRWLAGTLGYLGALERGDTPSDELAQIAFRDTIDLPRRYFLYNVACFAAGGALIATAMVIRFRSLDPILGLYLFASPAGMGVVSQTLVFVMLKAVLEPVRNHLAGRVVDPDLRERLVRRIPLGVQIFVALAGLTFGTAVHTMLLSESRSLALVGHLASASRSAALGAALARVKAGEDLEHALRSTSREFAPLGIALAAVRPDALPIDAASLSALDVEAREALERIASTPPGRPTGELGPNASWRRTAPGGPVLVAMTAAGEVPASLSEAGGRIFLLAAAVVGVALLVGTFAARDLSHSTGSMREHLRRIASGDLTPGETFESENELGELARALERMRGSLRETVGWLLGSADRVRQTAAAIAGTTREVAAESRAQVDEIAQITGAVDLVTAQMAEIAASSSSASQSVEESSSALTELRSVGAGLHDSAGSLSERASEAATSIEEMTRTVRAIVGNTEELSAVVDDVSGALAQVETQLQEVEAHASEATSLSARAVDSAEKGRERVQRTIEGMEKIREATAAAERVIENLLERTGAIGSIVNVIEEVADETNLLALNAAIIAAQAGEHGRAFAVVADEIKGLADRVVKNTKEISSVIENLQRESEHAAGVIRTGAKNVALGVDLSAEAGLALEEITDAARQSGARIGEILAAFQDHARTALHVVELMDRVRQSVVQIRSATQEQSKGSEVVLRTANTVEEVARQVRSTAGEQDRSTRHISESVERLRDTIVEVHRALEEQRRACERVMDSLGAMQRRTESTEGAARRTDEAMSGLLERFEELRANVGRRFRL